MTCKWNTNDCRNANTQCHTCVIHKMNYVQMMVKKTQKLAHRQQKADKRTGSSFEYRNHQNNSALIKDTVSSMTPNSGATSRKKGDEQISGIISVMEELKTKIVKQAPGKETFTIKKEWLEKLRREACIENKEFWYLKFNFYESDEDIYVICEQDIIMSFVKTIIEDRRAVTAERLRADVAEKRRQKVEADLVSAIAETEFLKAQLNLTKFEKEA